MSDRLIELLTACSESSDMELLRALQREPMERNLRMAEEAIEGLIDSKKDLSPGGPGHKAVSSYAAWHKDQAEEVMAKLELARSSAEEAIRLLFDCLRKSESYLALEPATLVLVSDNLRRVKEFTDTMKTAVTELHRIARY